MSNAFYICNHDGLVLQCRKQIGDQYLIETSADKTHLWVTKGEYDNIPEGCHKCTIDVKDNTTNASAKPNSKMFYVCNHDGLVLQLRKQLAFHNEENHNVCYLIEFVKDKTHQFVTQEEFETIPEGCHRSSV
jgi:hypothetical protein